MGRQRKSFVNAVEYAQNLMLGGKDIDTASKLAGHRYDEPCEKIKRKINKINKEALDWF